MQQQIALRDSCAGSRISFRSRKRARCTRPGHGSDDRSAPLRPPSSRAAILADDRSALLRDHHRGRVGVAPHAFPLDVIGVTRTYPIRVAGNSGPFDVDSIELSWRDVAANAGAPAIVEHTSVTGALRRVATFSPSGFLRASLVNRPTEIALTFADYLDWSVHERDEISRPIEGFIEQIEKLAGAPVSIVKTGPHMTIDLDEYRRIMLRKLG